MSGREDCAASLVVPIDEGVVGSRREVVLLLLLRFELVGAADASMLCSCLVVRE